MKLLLERLLFEICNAVVIIACHRVTGNATMYLQLQMSQIQVTASFSPEFSDLPISFVMFLKYFSFNINARGNENNSGIFVSDTHIIKHAFFLFIIILVLLHWGNKYKKQTVKPQNCQLIKAMNQILAMSPLSTVSTTLRGRN